ncbi:MAG: DUF4215 domain-containing protein, partial [Myxococcales bacterium]|nr:DUF4215 domain-containing protein [Myxococcales bacterium]
MLSTPSIVLVMPEDGTTTIDATAVDPEGETLRYTATRPAHGELTGAGPVYTYKPAKDYAGSDALTITITVRRHLVEVPVSITIVGVDDAPVAADLAATTNEDQGVAIALTAADGDSTLLTYEVVAGPAHGTLTGHPPAITYTPAAHYHGSDSFTFRASDGELDSNAATVAITIADVVTCGDGFVEGAEQCDDGNAIETDACLASCMAATCGDGAIQAGVETCDDGNGSNTDGCVNTCVPASCGDGFAWFGEEACDDGNDDNADACRNSCEAASCGDGFVQAGVEACDDANDDNTDACIDTCVAAACGDGFVEAGVEQCDDANQDDGDACRNDCTLPAPPVCGDGDLEGAEECDDGNLADGDGCGHSCLIERCGDGLVQFSRGEQCDDGNAVDGDGCSATCQVDPFVTTAAIKISDTLSCTTAVANAARKVAVDGSGTIYAVMHCGATAVAVTSRDRGLSVSAPFDLTTGLADAENGIAQVAVNSGPSGVAYAALLLNTGAVYLRTTQDGGLTWGPAVAVGTAANPSSGLSLESFNDDVYVGFSVPGGVGVARNHSRGSGTFELTPVAMGIAFFDLLYDVVQGTLAVTADTPGFHIRVSTDAGVTFAAEANPPGQEFFSDWAIGNGNIFAVGINLGAQGDANRLYIIPSSNVATSSFVAGLPVVTTPQSRSVAADAEGNAYVGSQLNGGGVQLDRLG